MRHQLLPGILLNVSSQTALIANRCRGGLTGSWVAGELGRILVQATIRQVLPFLKKYAWKNESVAIAVSSFVDNLYFTASSVWAAIYMADTFEEHLCTVWGQHIKPSSKQVLTIFGLDDSQCNSSGWRVLT